MGSSVFALISLAVAASLAVTTTPIAMPAQQLPQLPNTAVSYGPTTRTVFAAAEQKPTEADYPVRVRVPSIGLDAPIQNMGLTKSGELDVPDGSTNNVGWYKDGTVPGFTGSAVFDAHVYAAFAKLRYALPGTDIYVTTASGKTLHFRVQDSRVYKLSELSPKTLFGAKDAKRLNLITCAGSPTADGSTYTHRLVAFATLVAEY